MALQPGQQLAEIGRHRGVGLRQHDLVSVILVVMV